MNSRRKLNGHRVPATVHHAANAPAPDTGEKITTERVQMSIRTRFDPLPSLNPRLLVRYLQQFEFGYLDLAARTWDAMERRDDRLSSVVPKAKSALSRTASRCSSPATCPRG